MIKRILSIIKWPYRLANRIRRYFGLAKPAASPLAKTDSEEGKQKHVREVKRAQLLDIIECKGVDEIRDILNDGPTSWQCYDHLRMNQDEISSALKAHLYHLLKLQENETVYYRRRMIAGLGAIAVGGCVPQLIKLLLSKEVSSRNHGRRNPGRRTYRR